MMTDRLNSSKLEFDQLTSREIEVLRRLATGRSDQEIAQELFLSVNTVKWHNRNIYAKLGVNGRTKTLAFISTTGLLNENQFEETPTKKTCKHNLPSQVSSFVGRDLEINKIYELLDANRLVTLTGPGGVGKTRLALKAAAQLVSAEIFQDGIYIIELAPINQPEKVGDAIVEQLGLFSFAGSTTRQLLIDHLKDKQILLLIDNYEHLLEAAPLVIDLLHAVPGLKVLTTSREPLQLTGELIFKVPPLSLPDIDGQLVIDKLAHYEFVALFIDRARAVQSEFNPDQEDLWIVSDICKRLDGLPLAIELAAARIQHFHVRDLLNQAG